jgi:Uma2 family endonuclease
VKLGVRLAFFESWKIWERDRGTPELCVEILSPSDTKEKLSWEEKMERYADLGTQELCAFNVDAPPGSRLRAWDRLDDDLVERVIAGESTPCFTQPKPRSSASAPSSREADRPAPFGFALHAPFGTIGAMVSALDLRHVRPVKPLHFPVEHPEWEVATTLMHQLLAMLAYNVLTKAARPAHTVGSDQFIYFDAGDPKRRCDPDAFVKLGVPQSDFDNWKIWEKDRGTPELCVEIFSHTDDLEPEPWDQKMSGYLSLGVRELVAFDVNAPPGTRLRAWDHIQGDLVERIVENETTPCLTLDLHWVVVPSLSTAGDKLPAALRLARTSPAQGLVPTHAEAAVERALADAAAARERTEAAEAEIARLRAEIEALRQKGT